MDYIEHLNDVYSLVVRITLPNILKSSVTVELPQNAVILQYS